MDKKILFIGLATLFMVLISTLFLIILVVKPEMIPLDRSIRDTSKIKIGGLDTLNPHAVKVFYDSLNLQVSTIALKRENQIVNDSNQRVQNLANYYRGLSDSLNSELKKKNDSLNSTGKKYSDLLKVNDTLKTSRNKQGPGQQPTPGISFTDLERKGFAKLYDNMTPENAAKQIEEMSDIEAAKILILVESKQGAKIMDKIETKKAAKIWNLINSKTIK